MNDVLSRLGAAVGPVFRTDLRLVVVIVLAVVSALILWRVGPKKVAAFFKTKDGLGIARGVVLGPVVIVVIAVVLAVVFTLLLPSKARAEGFSVPGTWLNDSSVFMGIDRTKKLSPMCDPGGVDQYSTSNLGAKLNIWQSPSGNVRFNGMYTHHSCALNPDNRSYDALGVQVEWTFWRR